MALADVKVLLVDCQATGASPTYGSVLELGWGLARGAEAEPILSRADWIRLPEGGSVSPRVRKLTGYDAAFAEHAIGDREAWASLRSSVDGSLEVPTVIHYARFELAFLKDWAERFEPGPFPLDAVCLHEIAKRLHPDLPRRSLRALAGFLGHSLHLERRSLGHVEATGFVWHRLCQELAQRGIQTWPALKAWLGEPLPKRSRSKKIVYPIDRERYRSLPDSPGVYRFVRSNGDVLYVGKAASLKKRVSSHFQSRATKLLAPEMLTQVSDIQVTLVPTALEAALLENETIKELHPPYNVQLSATAQPVWYATREFDAAAPGPGIRHGVGPLASEYSLSALGELIERAAEVPPSAASRARLVGVSTLAPPPEDVFAAGFADFIAAHPEFSSAQKSPRLRSLALARKLLVLGVRESEEPEQESASSEWDAARVARHIEGALIQSYRAYRRARWLMLLCDSDVWFREPHASGGRLLELRAGSVVAASDAKPGPAPNHRLRPSKERTTFTRADYDRLRVLTSELKRIVRDGGEVSVWWGPCRKLAERWLSGVLRLV